MQSIKRMRYMIAGLVIMLLSGFVYAWSVMARPISASRPEWSAAQLSLTFTLVMIFFCIGGVIAGFLGRKLSVAKYMVLSAGMYLIGFLLTGFCGSQIGVLYLGFGVFGGVAAGMTYNVVMSTLSAWFPDKQGLISGIMMMGFGISSFIIGKVFAAMTPSDGSDAWQTTFKIMGIFICVVLIICGCFLKYPEKNQIVTGEKKNAVTPSACEVGPGQMVRMKSFWFYYIWAVLIGAAGLAIVSQGNGIAGEVAQGISDANLATVTGLLSLFNGIGRVIFGKVYDKKGVRFTLISDLIIYAVAVALILAALLSGQFGLLIIAFIVYGIAYGGVTPLGSAVISDFYGRTHYSRNFSIVTTTLMLASLSSTISGKLYDMSQSYLSTIYLALILWACSFVISFGIRRPKKIK